MPFMSTHRIYLAKSGPTSQRSHFAIFIPNDNDSVLDENLEISEAVGTIINVVGEPLMLGYKLEIKRNYNCGTNDVRKLVFLGRVDSNYLYKSPLASYVEDDIPRARLEECAAKIPPPPRGQDIRAPIDGVRAHKSLFDSTQM